jgi:hypothetical protein
MLAGGRKVFKELDRSIRGKHSNKLKMSKKKKKYKKKMYVYV